MCVCQKQNFTGEFTVNGHFPFRLWMAGQEGATQQYDVFFSKLTQIRKTLMARAQIWDLKHGATRKCDSFSLFCDYTTAHNRNAELMSASRMRIRVVKAAAVQGLLRGNLSPSGSKDIKKK